MVFSSEQAMRALGALRPARPPAGDVALRREMLTLPDGYRTAVLRHVPAVPAGLPVLYAHGIQSHPGWFIGSAQALARCGHEVFQVVRRGSGEAGAARGDARSARQLIDDVRAAVEYVTAATGAAKVVLLGVSWGGKLLTAYALGFPQRSASLMLVAPGLAARVGPSAWTRLAVAACWLCCPRRYFDIPLSDPALFTDNPAMRDYLRGDRHRLMRATARFMVASHVLDRIIARAARASALTVPTTLLLARRDRIIDNDRTRRLVERLTGDSARVVELDAAHTIEFETDPAEFYALLCQAVAGGL